MKKEELRKLFGSETFSQKLKEVNSMDSLQKFLAAYNLKMSVAQINTVAGSGAELGENELTTVTGGVAAYWSELAKKCFEKAAAEFE